MSKGHLPKTRSVRTSPYAYTDDFFSDRPPGRMSHRIEFPAFREEEPVQWFAEMEQLFAKFRVTTDSAKCAAVAAAVARNDIVMPDFPVEVLAAADSAAPYEMLKNALLTRWAAEKRRDPRPSELLGALRARHPDVSAENLRAEWLRKLPCRVRFALDACHGMSVGHIAALADRIVDLIAEATTEGVKTGASQVATAANRFHEQRLTKLESAVRKIESQVSILTSTHEEQTESELYDGEDSDVEFNSASESEAASEVEEETNNSGTFTQRSGTVQHMKYTHLPEARMDDVSKITGFSLSPDRKSRSGNSTKENKAGSLLVKETKDASPKKQGNLSSQDPHFRNTCETISFSGNLKSKSEQTSHFGNDLNMVVDLPDPTGAVNVKKEKDSLEQKIGNVGVASGPEMTDNKNCSETSEVMSNIKSSGASASSNCSPEPSSQSSPEVAGQSLNTGDPTTVEALTKVVKDAVKEIMQKMNKNKEPAKRKEDAAICYYHSKFGHDSYRCRSPCDFIELNTEVWGPSEAK